MRNSINEFHDLDRCPGPGQSTTGASLRPWGRKKVPKFQILQLVNVGFQKSFPPMAAADLLGPDLVVF